MSEIVEPQNARSRRTRAALLDAALAILQRDGFEALTMASVGEEAGVSRRGVYLHFRSRADIVRGLFDHVADAAALDASLAPVRDADDPVDALTAWAHHLAGYHPRVLPVDRAIERVRDRDPDAAEHYSKVQAAQRETCRLLASGLSESGRLADPWTVTTATDMLWAQVSSEVIGGLLEQCGWSQDELADHLAAMYRATFVAGVRARRASPGQSAAGSRRATRARR